jgi:hypothetical protein
MLYALWRIPCSYVLSIYCGLEGKVLIGALATLVPMQVAYRALRQTARLHFRIRTAELVLEVVIFISSTPTFIDICLLNTPHHTEN